MMTNWNDIYTTPLSPEECLELTRSFNQYLKTLESVHNKVDRLSAANNLIKEYKPLFLKNPAVSKSHKSTRKKDADTFFDLNLNDISNLTTTRELHKYKQSQFNIKPIKARLLIFSMELFGFYKRPPHRVRNNLYEAVMADIYSSPVCRPTLDHNKRVDDSNKDLPGRIAPNVMKNLIGTYQLFRKSFNSSFPGHVATHTLTIFPDIDSAGNQILSYKTRNKYTQIQSADSKDSLKRVRVSKGHIFNYQGLLFFLGGITYSHLNQADYTSEEKNTPDSGDYNYPEIKLMHLHGGDKNSIRGIMLSHFPFLGLPVSTSVLMTKLSHEKASEIEALEAKEKRNNETTDESKKIPLTTSEKALIARYYGNINPMLKPAVTNENEEVKRAFEELVSLINSKFEFISNQIEPKYSQMLTP